MPQQQPIANFLKQYIKFPTSKPALIAQPTQQRITIPRIQQFSSKIMKLRRQHENIEVITDYDHTLTKFKDKRKQCDSLFGMWGKNSKLPQKFRQQLLNNYMFYGPYQTDGTISFLQRYQLINQLYTVQTKLFESHKITVDMAKETLDLSNIVFRPYTNQLLEILNQANLPLYIISGGISDIIFTTIHDLCGGKVHPNVSIHSNEMEMYQLHQVTNKHVLVDYRTMGFWNALKGEIHNQQSSTTTHHQNPSPSLSDNYFVKFKTPLIHSYNKFEIMRNHTSKRRHCILMGDLVSDIYMARGVNYDTILSIFYAKEGDTDQRALAEEKFDLVVEGDGSHKIVVELMKVITGKKNINWKYLTSVHKNLHELLV